MTKDDCPPIGDEISAVVAEYFVGVGMNRKEACELSEGVSDTLLHLYAGQDVRFPSRRWKEIKERNREIQRRYDGDNITALSRRYRLSTVAIRRIIKTGSSSGHK